MGLGENESWLRVSRQALLKVCRHLAVQEVCFGTISSFEYCVFCPLCLGCMPHLAQVQRSSLSKPKGRDQGWGAVRKETYKNLSGWTSPHPLCWQRNRRPACSQHDQNPTLYCCELLVLRPSQPMSLHIRAWLCGCLKALFPYLPFPSGSFPGTCQGRRGFSLVSAVGWGMRKCLKTEASPHVQSRWRVVVRMVLCVVCT